MRTLVTLLLACLAVNASAQSKQPPSLRDLEKIQREGDSWSAKQGAIARERESACVSAFGHRKFCECLSSELHWVLSFDSYVRLISTSTQASVTPDDKVLLDSARRSRERCVAKHVQQK